MKWLLLGLLLWWPSSLVAQSHPTAPNVYIMQLPSTETGNIAYYSAPSIYKIWWKEVKKCAGVSSVPDSSFNSLKWVSVDSDGFMAMGHGPYMGYTYAWDDEIWVLERYKMDERLIKHEMLHYLLWTAGRRDGYHQIEFITCNLMKS